jgi:hypothetical protein
MAHGQAKYQFTVDEILYGTDDRVLGGRQIREAAALAPASSFILVQVAEGGVSSIGLEEQVRFPDGKIGAFLSFKSDRIYTLTVNERGWEWGAPTIAAADIYRHGSISEEMELVLDSSEDDVIAMDAVVKLDGKGVERIRSREPKIVIIKVNGRSKSVEKRPHSYREIATLGYPEPNFETFNYTITYLHGVHGAEGDLVEGETIAVKKGMVFNVRRSDKS